MEALGILRDPSTEAQWTCDAEADVLYISFGAARPAVSVDVGDGVVLRYDEATQEMVGLTLVGLQQRLRDEWRATA